MPKDLCNVCRGVFIPSSRLDPGINPNLDRASQKFYIHHETPTELKKAAEKGCQLCAALWRSLTVQDRASINIVHSRDSKLAGIPVVSYHISTGKPYFIEFRLRTTTSNFIERVFSLRPTQRNSIAKPLVSRIPTNTGSEEVSALANGWISNCIRNHEKCNVRGRSNGDAQLPTRLLWVGPSGNTSIRLCHAKDLLKGTPYMTLSHRWVKNSSFDKRGADIANNSKGKDTFLTLTTENMGSFEGGISQADLPKTFQDAIIFTRRISVQYIWIDSMCIIQNSAEDWEREALRMEQVYSNAYCNVAATAGSDSRSGCFVEREVGTCIPMTFNVPSNKGLSAAFQRAFSSGLRSSRSTKSLDIVDPGAYLCEEQHLWRREITNSALGRRAWVFQERLLAKRVLHFASSQIFFECCTFQAAEISREGMSLPNYRGTRLKSEFADALDNLDDYRGISRMEELIKPTPEQRALKTWKNIVQQFSACELTYETDRLRAIAGVARCMKDTLKCKYIAGFWEYELASQLVWRTIGTSTRPSTYQAPTWSWASRPGEVFFDTSGSLSKGYLWQQFVTIQDVEVRTTDGNEMSHVLYGCLHLQGLLIPSPIRPGKLGASEGGKNLVILVRQYWSEFTPDICDDPPETYQDRIYYCLPCFFSDNGSVFWMQGLVLQRSGERGHYLRVGAFTCSRGGTSIEFGKNFKRALTIRGSLEEKSLMTWDHYEDYDEENDRYTFTII